MCMPHALPSKHNSNFNTKTQYSSPCPISSAVVLLIKAVIGHCTNIATAFFITATTLLYRHCSLPCRLSQNYCTRHGGVERLGRRPQWDLNLLKPYCACASTACLCFSFFNSVVCMEMLTATGS